MAEKPCFCGRPHARGACTQDEFTVLDTPDLAISLTSSHGGEKEHALILDFEDTVSSEDANSATITLEVDGKTHAMDRDESMPGSYAIPLSEFGDVSSGQEAKVKITLPNGEVTEHTFNIGLK